MLRSKYFYNILTTNHRWLVVISSNLNLTLRLPFYPTITTYHLGFVVKMMWTYHFLYIKKKNVAIDLWQWHCRNREEKNKIVGFHCFLTSCLLCMHHSRIYQCCWCIYMNLFVQGKLHFFHCFLTSCLLCMHHSRISIKYRMLFLQNCLMQLLSEKTVIPTIFFPTYFGNAIATNSLSQFYFSSLFQQCHCHKSMATFFFF